MIILIPLAFTLGYLLAKNGRLYLYSDGQRHDQEGAITYYPWLGFVKGIDVNLVGIDFTSDGVVPIYRPTLAFQARDGAVTIGIRTGDFSEATMRLSYTFPFVKFNHQRNVHEVKHE